MEGSQAVVLALLQGLTEFLPVSSSAHLVLLPRLLHWSDQGLAFDIAVHFGTLIAVIVYFRRDLYRLSGAWWRSVAVGESTPDGRLAWGVLLGTTPIVVVGLAVSDWVEGPLRGPVPIALANIVFCLLLWWSDARGARRRGLGDMSLNTMILIGCAQALAVIPGASRSGVTLTAALALGYRREDAARISFLLAIPAIALAAGWQTASLLDTGVDAHWESLALGAACAALAAATCIHLFLKMMRSFDLRPFVIYRLLLGVALLWFFL